MIGFELVEAGDYCGALLREIPRAKKRITIAAMVVLWGERAAPVFNALEAAAKRGVQVTILFDNYTRLTRILGLQPPSSGPERLRQTFRALERLSAHDAKIYNFGKIGFPPQKGRCHVKATIIDDISYSFGGINFHDERFISVDYMLRSTDGKVADCLQQLVEKIANSRPPLADGEVGLDKNTSILFDGGRPKHSLIYERACELASQAKNITYAGPMVPSGSLARLLNEKNATIYSTRAEQMTSLEGIAQAFDQQRYRVHNRYRGNKYLHCKTILFEMPSGRKILLSGSHNFSYRGVAYGTQEIALCSTDAKLWDYLHAFIQKRIIDAPTKK